MDDLGAPHFRKPPCRKSELAKGYAAMHLPCLRRMNEAQENWSRTLQPLYPETPTEAHQKNPKKIQVQLVQCNILWPARERHQIICTSCFTRWIVFVDKAHRISHAVAENGIAIATIGRRKTDCEDVAMAWKPGVSWDDWDTLWEGVPILKGWSLQCNGKSFLLWSELSTDGTKWGWMARKMNSVHHIDLSSHRVSWFFLHMASWIKMSGNFYASVASLVAFITLFCSISQRYM